MCVGHMCVGTPKSQKKMSDPLELKLQARISCYVWTQGTNLDPLEEQQTFLTSEPSFEPHTRSYFIKDLLLIVITTENRQRHQETLSCWLRWTISLLTILGFCQTSSSPGPKNSTSPSPPLHLRWFT